MHTTEVVGWLVLFTITWPLLRNLYRPARKRRR